MPMVGRYSGSVRGIVEEASMAEALVHEIARTGIRPYDGGTLTPQYNVPRMKTDRKSSPAPKKRTYNEESPGSHSKRRRLNEIFTRDAISPPSNRRSSVNKGGDYYRPGNDSHSLASFGVRKVQRSAARSSFEPTCSSPPTPLSAIPIPTAEFRGPIRDSSYHPTDTISPAHENSPAYVTYHARNLTWKAPNVATKPLATSVQIDASPSLANSAPSARSPNTVLPIAISAPETVDYNGLKSVPIGPKSLPPTSKSPQKGPKAVPHRVDPSIRRLPHIFIPAESVPALTSTVKHMHRHLKLYLPAESNVRVDTLGWYLTFEDTASDRERMSKCYASYNGGLLFSMYVMTMHLYPYGQPSIEDADFGEANFVPEPRGIEPSTKATPPIVENGVPGILAVLEATENETLLADEQKSKPISRNTSLPLSGSLRGPSLQDRDDTASCLSGLTGSEMSASKQRRCHVCKTSPVYTVESLIRCSSCTRCYHRHCHRQLTMPTKTGPDHMWQCHRCVKKKVDPKSRFSASSPVTGSSPAASVGEPDLYSPKLSPEEDPVTSQPHAGDDASGGYRFSAPAGETHEAGQSDSVHNEGNAGFDAKSLVPGKRSASLEADEIVDQSFKVTEASPLGPPKTRSKPITLKLVRKKIVRSEAATETLSRSSSLIGTPLQDDVEGVVTAERTKSGTAPGGSGIAPTTSSKLADAASEPIVTLHHESVPPTNSNNNTHASSEQLEKKARKVRPSAVQTDHCAGCGRKIAYQPSGTNKLCSKCKQVNAAERSPEQTSPQHGQALERTPRAQSEQKAPAEPAPKAADDVLDFWAATPVAKPDEGSSHVELPATEPHNDTDDLRRIAPPVQFNGPDPDREPSDVRSSQEPTRPPTGANDYRTTRPVAETLDLGDSLDRPKGTYVKLIGMALCAASGRATCTEIIQWVVNNIPNYEYGKGKWESGLRATMTMQRVGYAGGAGLWKIHQDGATKSEGFAYELVPGQADKMLHWDPVTKQPVMPFQSTCGSAKGSPVLKLKVTSKKSPGGRKPSSVSKLASEPVERQSRQDSAKDLSDFADNTFHARNGLAGQTDLDMDNEKFHDGDVFATMSLPVANTSASGKPIADIQRLERDRADPMEIDLTSVANDLIRPRAPLSSIEKLKSRPVMRAALETMDSTSCKPKLEEIIELDAKRSIHLAKSLYDEWPEYDPKTAFDANAKVGEIKRRPTRKQRFGKPGATFEMQAENCVSRYVFPDRAMFASPRKPPAAFVAYPWEAGQENIVRCDSIEDLFGMPNNPIAIVQDGELIGYRDGTKNEEGTLPRAKVVYRL